MTIRKLFPLLFAAVAAAVLAPEGASAQCWYCDDCCFGTGNMCHGDLGAVTGDAFCHAIRVGPNCICGSNQPGRCFPDGDEQTAIVDEEGELTETIAALKAGKSIPADGFFFYVTRGDQLVIRRKCDVLEVARLEIAELEASTMMAGG